MLPGHTSPEGVNAATTGLRQLAELHSDVQHWHDLRLEHLSGLSDPVLRWASASAAIHSLSQTPTSQLQPWTVNDALPAGHDMLGRRPPGPTRPRRQPHLMTRQTL